MLSHLLGPFSQSISNIELLILLLNIILHIIFASGVARDVSHLNKAGLFPRFIPGIAWVLATLIGGILVLALYWLMHHSTLARK